MFQWRNDYDFDFSIKYITFFKALRYVSEVLPSTGRHISLKICFDDQISISTKFRDLQIFESSNRSCVYYFQAHKTRKGFLKSIGSGSKAELRLGSRRPLRSSGPQREEPTRVTSIDGRHLTVCRQRRQTRLLSTTFALPWFLQTLSTPQR